MKFFLDSCQKMYQIKKLYIFYPTSDMNIANWEELRKSTFFGEDNRLRLLLLLVLLVFLSKSKTMDLCKCDNALLCSSEKKIDISYIYPMEYRLSFKNR